MVPNFTLHRRIGRPHRVALAATILLGACAHQDEFKTLAVPTVDAAAQPYSGPRTALAIGQFDNRSNYLRGVFAGKTDRLGNQAQTILSTHLQQSGRFNLLDRSGMAEIRQEAQLQNRPQSLQGADYVIVGDVTEFGRKEVGDMQLFGLLGRGKSQIAYAKVSLNVVNTHTSEVVYSVQGAGQYSLSEREVLGFGGTAGYDGTLNGKVLDLAIREAVNRLVAAMDAGNWRPTP